MTNFTFRPAVRENVGLWINLIGGTGSGKTFTALRLASGISGDKPFALIDTENRRGLHYADLFNFHHAELTPPFRPDAYADAVMAADKAGYPVIVIDSGSHVWAGEGGVLDWQEEELTRMAGDDYGKRERSKMAAWIKPKTAHKRMVQKLLQVKAHIILCLRAEEKIEMVKGSNGKLEIRQKESLTGKDGWIPICDKNLPFEATCSFLLLANEPGKPHPIKLQEQHKNIFVPGKLIDEEAGKRLAAWANGETPVSGSGSQVSGQDPQTVRIEMLTEVQTLCQQLNRAGDATKWTASSLLNHINHLFSVEDGLDSLGFESLNTLIADLRGRLDKFTTEPGVSGQQAVKGKAGSN